MHIGLYFGSFTPVHTGHLIIASHAVDHAGLERLWFVVSPHNPLKESASLLNEYDRLHLVQRAVEGDRRFRASNVEFALPRPSYTIDTLTYLREKFPQDTFSIVMGSDSLQNITRWKNSGILLHDYQIIVYERPGAPVADIAGARITRLQAPLLDISASFIRTQLQTGKSIRYLVPDTVLEEITAGRHYL